MPNKKIFTPLILILILLSLNGCSMKSKPASIKTITLEEKQFLNAEKLFSNKKYNKALKAYDIFIKNYPNSPFIPTALLKKGLMIEQQDKNKAYILYDKIIKEFSNSDPAVEATIKASEILIEKNDLETAYSICGFMLSKNISSRDKLRLKIVSANIIFLEKKYFDAINILSEIIRTDPSRYQNIRHLIARSAENLNENELLKAKDMFENQDTKALFLKYYAILFEKEKNFSKAKEILNSILNEYKGTETEKEVKNELSLLESRSNIKIGCILPLAGKFEPFGQMALKGIQLALNEFKQKNPEITIRLLIKNNKSTDNGSKKAAEELCEKGVSAIIGPFHTAKAAASVAQQNMIPMMIMTNKDDVKKDKDFVFRNFITPEMEASTLVRYAMETGHVKKFAILYPDESYGRKFMNIFWDVVKNNGGKITGVEKYSPDSTDYSTANKKLTGTYYKELRHKENLEETDIQDKQPEDAKIKEENLKSIIDFEALFIPDGAAKSGSIIPQLAYYDTNKVMILGPSLWQNKDLIQYSEGYINNAVFPSLFSADSTKEAKFFTDAFRSVFRETPGFIEAISYDSAMFIFQATANIESSIPSLIKESLLHSVFHGATGVTSFDKTGECSKKIILKKVRHKTITEIK